MAVFWQRDQLDDRVICGAGTSQGSFILARSALYPTASIKRVFYMFRYDPCNRRKLRTRDLMEVTRVGATLFPCIVSRVLMAYKPPAPMVLAMQRFICVLISFCYGVLSSHSNSSRDTVHEVLTCELNLVNRSLALGIWEYYKLSQYEAPGSLRKDQLTSLISDSFKCFDGIDMHLLKGTPEISLSILKMIYEKIF